MNPEQRTYTATASTDQSPSMNGSLLWFDRVQNLGIVVRDDGERFDVQGDGFAPGSRPTGRCRGTRVTFDVREDAVGPLAVSVAVVPEIEQRRARPRRRSF
jgi:cold shock CspA family protein